MDFEQNNTPDLPLEQPLPTPPLPLPSPPKKKKGWRIFWGIIISFSILANLFLLLMLVGVVMFFSAGRQDGFNEEVIATGSHSNKIAIINMNGIIAGDMAEEFTRQIDIAYKDNSVKALIIKIHSPGGTVSASDYIYNEIIKFRQKTGKPVLAFMQGIAASGGYYTSVACDKIIAEPTTITGSIGVIMSYLVLQDLLNEKLGILPVTVKSGKKKDWPSAFQPPTEEQLQYLQDKLINPAYERFVQLVAEGRPELSLDRTHQLADGSIYYATEALVLKLIDQIGYKDEAIQMASAMANIENPQVIEYRKPFSFSDFLTSSSENKLKINRAAIYEFTSPEMLYLWNPLN